MDFLGCGLGFAIWLRASVVRFVAEGSGLKARGFWVSVLRVNSYRAMVIKVHLVYHSSYHQKLSPRQDASTEILKPLLLDPMKPGFRLSGCRNSKYEQRLLRGSWDLVTRVTSKVTIVISTFHLD